MPFIPRLLAATSAAAVISLSIAGPAGACGGLVGENGTISLVKTTTLAAYADGVERYVTSFEFTGEGEEVGSIVPLPDVPTKVERGGDWTLQRLLQEVAPPARSGSAGGDAALASVSAEVLLETKIDALDITVLRVGLGLGEDETVQADVFLLTDRPAKLLAGGPGLRVERDGPASNSLLADLRSDKGMEWLPAEMQFAHLEVDVRAGDLDYDLAMAVHRDQLPALIDTGVDAAEATTPRLRHGRSLVVPVVIGVAVAVLAAAVFGRPRPHRAYGI
jgi:hypothetical protein